VAVSCKYGAEPSGSGPTDLFIYLFIIYLLIYLFNDALSLSRTIKRQMKLCVYDELERMWKKGRSLICYYPGICLEGLRKATKTSVRIAGLRSEI
jgi:hypothetical protein